jgi:hypothetical protein
MAVTAASTPTSNAPVRGKILEAEVKVSVDAARPLPLACALYAIETSDGIWLCAYYGANRSNFDYLPQKGSMLEQSTLGITFHRKQFVPKDRYDAAVWEDFKKTYFIGYGSHEE